MDETLEIPPSPPSLEGVGWAAFGDLAFIADMVLILAVAVALASAIAYHPVTRRKASTLAELEQPKTFIMYAMVGAIITIIVKTMPSMALVVFGIGGLLRFRTDVGEAKDTGRVILVTVIGLACGLELYVVAVLTTALAYLLVWLLERQSIERLIVQGVEAERMPEASANYLAALREVGCEIIGEDKRIKKSGGSLMVIYRTPNGLTREQLQARLAEVPNSKRDTISWDGA